MFRPRSDPAAGRIRAMARWAVVIVLVSGPASLVHAEEAAAPNLRARLRDIQPAIPAPILRLFESSATSALPVRLLGIDLEQGGGQIHHHSDRIAADMPLELNAYWEATQPTAVRFPWTVKISSHDGKIARNFGFSGGPADTAQAWQAGCVYKQRVQIDLLDAARAFSGKGHLSVNLASSAAAAGALIPLLAVPIELKPVLSNRDANPADIKRYVNAAFVDLDVSFRLGYQAEITIPVDRPVPARSLAVVSAYSYGSVPQGEAVAELIVGYEDGNLAALVLGSGKTTARGDYDFFGQGRLNHDKIDILESREASYLSQTGAPFQTHKYAAVFQLPRPYRNVASITFRSVRPVILDVYDAVLVPADPSTITESAAP